MIEQQAGVAGQEGGGGGRKDKEFVGDEKNHEEREGKGGKGKRRRREGDSGVEAQEEEEEECGSLRCSRQHTAYLDKGLLVWSLRLRCCSCGYPPEHKERNRHNTCQSLSRGVPQQVIRREREGGGGGGGG